MGHKTTEQVTAIFIFLFLYIILCLSLSWVFPKAGVEASKAWIPGINFVEWCKIIGRKPSHALWLLFPIVNIFIFTGMCIDLVRSFGMMRFWHSTLAVILPPVIFYMIGKNDSIKYIEPGYTAEKNYHNQLHDAIKAKDENRINKLKSTSAYAKNSMREWLESIIFAVFAAAFIRMFLIEAFVIPTSSMEGSLKVGDFLFVSKAHYGIRMPMTVAMVPLLHNTIPILGTESYLSKPSLPYKRLPALSPIKRNDPFVFNWPAGDSVYVTKRVGQRFKFNNNPKLGVRLQDRNWLSDLLTKRITISNVVLQCQEIACRSLTIRFSSMG
ncbi:MAG: hypothetical protein IPM86_03145 [Saprospiraceae bacterium]|nr:hypothetical protein [Saprospiraceae bacterium]